MKQNAIKMACNAAVTILRVDQVGCYVPGYKKTTSMLREPLQGGAELLNLKRGSSTVPED